MYDYTFPLYNGFLTMTKYSKSSVMEGGYTPYSVWV